MSFALPTLIAILSALAGLWLTGARRRARIMVPFSAGVLLGVAIFGMLPEGIREIGWPGTVLAFGAGYLLLLVIDRYVYPVCPTCAHDHDHNSCTTALHGFAIPLVAAIGLHSFLDGWVISSAEGHLAIPLAVALHKVPEGLALGGILRAAVGARLTALGWSIAAEAPTLAGGLFGLAVLPHLSGSWAHYPLAAAGGCFFYLGFHAVHEEWKRRGAGPAFMPALTGAAGAAAIQQGVRVFFR